MMRRSIFGSLTFSRLFTTLVMAADISNNPTGTVQYYTIPEDGSYRFTAWGANGGDCDGCDPATCKGVGCSECEAQFHEGGRGALISATFRLHKGDEIEMLTGAKGEDCRRVRKELPGGKYVEAVTGAGGGGASSFRVVRFGGKGDPEVLMIAGGGGGASYFFSGQDAELEPKGKGMWDGEDGGTTTTIFEYHGGAGGGVSGNGASQSSDQTDVSGFVGDFDNNATLHGGFGSGAYGYGRI